MGWLGAGRAGESNVGWLGAGPAGEGWLSRSDINVESLLVYKAFSRRYATNKAITAKNTTNEPGIPVACHVMTKRKPVPQVGRSPHNGF